MGCASAGNAAAEALNIFKDPRARPVEISAVLEDDKDVGITKHGLRANGFHMRSGKQCGDDRIRDLVFNDVGRSPDHGV